MEVACGGSGVNAPSPADIVLELERRGDLFSLQCAGVPLWWFARQRLISLLRRQASGFNLLRTAESLSFAARVRKAAEAAGQLLGAARRAAQVEVLALSTTSSRTQVTPDGRAYDRYFDVLSRLQNLDYAVLEFPDNKSRSHRPFTEHPIYGDGISLLGNLGRATARFRRRWAAVEDFAEQVVSLLRENGAEVDWDDIRALVRREAAFVAWTRDSVERLLDQTSPRVVLVQCGYSPSHMVVQYLAKQREIPVIEVQHGLITRDNLGYRFALTSPAQLKASPFPDKVCVYGEHFRHLLLENPYLTEEDVLVTGYPYLWLKYQERRAKQDLSGARNILITSQPGLGSFWAEFARELADRTPWPIILKPHPSELGELEKTFGELADNPKISVVRDDRSIYDLFAEAAYHLSVFSTSHLEAIALGIKDIVVARAGLERHLGFLLQKSVPVAETVEDVARLIHSYPETPDATAYVRNEVFALDSDPLAILRDLLAQYL